jgi:hypothetical protein
MEKDLPLENVQKNVLDAFRLISKRGDPKTI